MEVISRKRTTSEELNKILTHKEPMMLTDKKLKKPNQVEQLNSKKYNFLTSKLNLSTKKKSHKEP